MPTQLKLGKAWIPWRLRMRVLVVSHRHLLPAIGALIVFGTFIVKDNVREHYRSVSNTLATAQSILAIRTDTTISKATLVGLAKKIDIVLTLLTSIGKHESMPDPKQLEGKDMDIWELIDLQPFEDVEDTAIMAALDAVCKDLPEEDKDCKRLPAMKEELKLAMKAGADEYMFRKNDWPSGREDEEDVLHKELDKLSKLRGKDARPLSDRLQELAEKITSSIEKVRSKAERIDRWLGKLSILLYSFGWGLGLLGKIYGVEGSGLNE
jgi:hypothetical protein